MNACRSKRGSSERGAVIVMVAVWLPVLALFVSFAVDFAHFFDYSRNLQNRADAAALAAGDAYGGTCFGNYGTAQTDAIGQTAQQYSGPPVQDPSKPYTVQDNLPYAYSTFTPNKYQNVPNLTQGTAPNFHLLLNSPANYGDPGAGDWQMGTGSAQGTSLALCDSTDEDGHGPMADVRVTQSNLGLFFPLLALTPSISAHARVALEESTGSGAVVPIAVRDPGAIQCIAVNYINAATGTPINASPIAMKEEGTDALTNDIIWDVPGGSSITMPAAGANAGVYAQVVTGPCGDNPSTYEPDNTGLLRLNVFSNATSPSAAVITSPGVFLTTGSCPNDNLSNLYFTDGACTLGIKANVLFPSGATNTGVSVTDSATNTTVNLVHGAGNEWDTPNNKPFPWTLDPALNPGADQFTVVATSGSGNNKVTTNLGVQQEAFGACNEAISTCPANGMSGSIVNARVHLPPPVGQPNDVGPESYAAGSSPTLLFTLEVAGLNNTPSNGPPTILRFSEPNKFASHATGLINCGQTAQGSSQAITAIISGCPVAGTTGTNGCPVTSNNFYFCSPLVINRRNSACPIDGDTGQAGSIVPPATSPSYRTAATPTVPTDCVGLVGGNKTPITAGIACRIFTNQTPASCANGSINNANCSADNWSPSIGASAVSGGDPRAITMVITAPEDLSGNNGPPVPIRNFATFYVTGWNLQGSASGCATYGALSPGALQAGDALAINQCTDGTTPPGGCTINGNPKNRNGGDAGEIWGYWMTYVDPSGIPSQTSCNTKAFGTCVPALTR